MFAIIRTLIGVFIYFALIQPLSIYAKLIDKCRCLSTLPKTDSPIRGLLFGEAIFRSNTPNRTLLVEPTASYTLNKEATETQRKTQNR